MCDTTHELPLKIVVMQLSTLEWVIRTHPDRLYVPGTNDFSKETKINAIVHGDVDVITRVFPGWQSCPTDEFIEMFRKAERVDLIQMICKSRGDNRPTPTFIPKINEICDGKVSKYDKACTESYLRSTLLPVLRNSKDIKNAIGTIHSMKNTYVDGIWNELIDCEAGNVGGELINAVVGDFDVEESMERIEAFLSAIESIRGDEILHKLTLMLLQKASNSQYDLEIFLAWAGKKYSGRVISEILQVIQQKKSEVRRAVLGFTSFTCDSLYSHLNKIVMQSDHNPEGYVSMRSLFRSDCILDEFPQLRKMDSVLCEDTNAPLLDIVVLHVANSSTVVLFHSLCNVFKWCFHLCTCNATSVPQVRKWVSEWTSECIPRVLAQRNGVETASAAVMFCLRENRTGAQTSVLNVQQLQNIVPTLGLILERSSLPEKAIMLNEIAILNEFRSP